MSSYRKVLQARVAKREKSAEEDRAYLEEINSFDWDPSKLKPPSKVVKDTYHVNAVYDKYRDDPEPTEERIGRMLSQMFLVVKSCSMCHLGRKMVDEHGTLFDPHVFSTMNFSRWMVVGQNPGFNECSYNKPFVGESGKKFDVEVEKNGLKRSDFYITNATKCYTVGNALPTVEQRERCMPILQMELNLLRPVLVITLGASAFSVFCPDLNYAESRGNIVESSVFVVKVFPIIHPSPRNMVIAARREEFEADIANLCSLIKAYRR